MSRIEKEREVTMDNLCRRYQETYGDASMSVELTEHGTTCEACQAFAQRQEALSRMAQSWKPPEFSPDFTLGVMARIAEESHKKRGLKDILAELFHTRLAVPLPVGALASFVMVGSLLMNLVLWNQESATLTGKVNQYVIDNPLVDPTPGVMTVSNDRPLTVPREWLGAGAGAFLLIPMVDMAIPFTPEIQPDNEKKVELKEI